MRRKREIQLYDFSYAHEEHITTLEYEDEEGHPEAIAWRGRTFVQAEAPGDDATIVRYRELMAREVQ